MTPQHAQRLAALLSESSLEAELISNRPSLGGISIDEIVSNAKKAEGWEACVKFIKSLVVTEEPAPTAPFVNTKKGFQ